jgi:hypothetical protein
MNIIIDNCPACPPVNRLVENLLFKGFKIAEQKLSDFHFQELYFKLKGPLSSLQDIDSSGFNIEGTKFICQCHWSTIEVEE